MQSWPHQLTGVVTHDSSAYKPAEPWANFTEFVVIRIRSIRYLSGLLLESTEIWDSFSSSG